MRKFQDEDEGTKLRSPSPTITLLYKVSPRAHTLYSKTLSTAFGRQVAVIATCYAVCPPGICALVVLRVGG